MFSALGFLLFFNFAFATSQIFVPSINIKYSEDLQKFELEPLDGGYKLRLGNLLDNLKEDVKEIKPGELEVKGQYRQYLNDTHILEVTYTAGRNGYVAKYRINKIENTFTQQASAAALKSRVG